MERAVDAWEKTGEDVETEAAGHEVVDHRGRILESVVSGGRCIWSPGAAPAPSSTPW
jgi:hypothetical protein